MEMKEKTMKDMFKLTFGEEVGNAVSHGVMALLCLLSLPFVAVYSYIKGGVVRSVGVSIFVICLFLMFLISTIYHSMAYDSKQKYVFRKLDHICIYLAIAGSYTPFALSTFANCGGIKLLIAVWTIALIGILSKLFFFDVVEISYSFFFLVFVFYCYGWNHVFRRCFLLC